jgi:hypothetical protein
VRGKAALLLAMLAVASGRGTAEAGRLGVRTGAGTQTRIITPTPVPATVKFAVLGCMHVGAPNGGTNPRNWYQLRKFIDYCNANGVDAIVVAGDWAQDGFTLNPDRPDTTEAIFADYDGEVIYCLGNHEADPPDTLLGGNPYATAIANAGTYFGTPDRFQGKNYYAIDWNGIRFICIQNNANYNTSEPSSSHPIDYRVNNPSYGGVVAKRDWDGINAAGSAQQQFITAAISTAPGPVVIVGHRPTFGDNDNESTRLNFASAAQGYWNVIENALPSGARALATLADQHVCRLTKAVNDSSLSDPNEKGIYHMQAISGFGVRVGEATDPFKTGGWLSCYVENNADDFTERLALTTVGIEDTLTTAGDPDKEKAWFGWIVTTHGDFWVAELYRVLTENSSGASFYTGAGNLVLVSRHGLPMDVN